MHQQHNLSISPLDTLSLSFSTNDDRTIIHKQNFQRTYSLFMIPYHNIQLWRESFTILQNFKNLTILYINLLFYKIRVRRVPGILAKQNIIFPSSPELLSNVLLPCLHTFDLFVHVPNSFEVSKLQACFRCFMAKIQALKGGPERQASSA
jgi:hypothetical protein